jgi:hypothetical protein
MLRVASGLLLRIDEVVVDDDLEHSPTRRDKDQIFDLVFELFQYPLRQTDGSRCVASLRAVFDGDLHPTSLGGTPCLGRVRGSI